MKVTILKGCSFLLMLFAFLCAHAQEEKEKKPKVNFKDSLDRRFDLSDWMIDENGFLPVGSIITEPALGGFGFAAGPVFLKKRPSVEIDEKKYMRAPDVTAALGGYTLNNSWFAGGGRFASFPKWKLRYKIAALYGDINLAFYRTILEEERQFDINVKIAPVFLQVARELKNPRWTLGGQYTFAYAKVAMEDGSDLPDFVEDKEVKSFISMLGLIGEYDRRDNIFTPSKGFKAHLHVDVSNHVFGSDHDFERLSAFIYWYHPIGKHWKNGKGWTSGWRADMQQSFGDAPFYMLPYVALRGVPVMRYQGNTTALVETEQRWDFVRRWSAVFFAGLGKGFDEYSEFTDAKLVYNYGGGFRYLIARKFKLRMGVDVAGGPQSWGYYIVFGSSWLK